MWTKYITRRLAVQVAQEWNFGFGEDMKKVYGIFVKNTLVFRDAQKTEYYVDDRKFKNYTAGLYKLLDNEKFIKSFHKEARAKLEKILKNVSQKFKRDLSKLSNKELLAIYKNYILPQASQFYVRMWTVFNIGEPLANIITANLKKYIDDKKKRTEYLLSLSSPLVPNDVLNERIDILKLALLKLNGENFLEKIKAHTQKYQHIPMFDFDHRPYDVQYFIKEIKSIKNPKKELTEIKNLFASRRKEFEEEL